MTTDPSTTAFSGPLFIIGLPRSGTKLIRDLLNQNPRIGIPLSETHFIPYWIERFGRIPNFDETAAFNAFFSEFCQTPFYENMARRGRRMTGSELQQNADLTSWASILETILRCYAPSNRAGSFIFGDKTPGYATHLPLLSAIFPKARFLHIIRDPRDYALSVNNAWGKHPFLAAHVWQETLKKARKTAVPLTGRYLEITYENLLSYPESVLKAICAYLDCDFIPEMTGLDRPSENLGDAKGRTDIVQDNTGKYLHRLTKAQIQRIEEIVYPMIGQDTPYEIHYGRQHRPLSPLSRRACHLYDGLASARFHVREKGLAKGLSYFYRLHIRSSWRQ